MLGPLAASGATLTAPTLALDGAISVGTAGVLALGSAGTVTEASAATLTAGTLVTAAGGIGGDLLLQAGHNTIGTLGDISVTGSMTLADSVPTLAVAGAVTALSTLALAVGGGLLSLDAGSTLDGGTVSLSAASIAGPAGVVNATTLALTPGVAAGDSVDLGDTGNAIATLTGFGAGGNVTIADGTALTVIGTVTAGGAMTLLMAGANTPLILGTSATNAKLVATPLSLDATSSIDATNATLVATELAVSAGTGGLVLNNASNSIGTLTALATSGNATIADGTGLILTGTETVTGTLLLTTPGSLDAAAAVVRAGTLGVIAGSGTADTILLSNAGNTIGSLATLSTGGSATLVDSTSLLLTGLASVGKTLVVDTAGSLDGSLGTVIAPTLRLASGTSATSGIVLTGASNTIGTLAALTAGGSATIDDATSLIVTGSPTVGGALVLTAAGSVDGAAAVLHTPSLSVTAGTASGDAILFTNAGNTIGTLTALSTGGSATIADTADLALSGTIAAAGTLALATAGSLAGAAGVVQAGTLAVTAGTATSDSIVLSNTGNAIGTLATLSAGGSATLADATSLIVTGAPKVGTALTLASNGSIDGSAATLHAPTLAVSAGTASGDDVLLTNAANTIGTLAALATGGNATIVDATDLALAGTIGTAGTLVLVTPGSILGAAGVVQAGTLTVTAGTSASDAIVLSNAGNSIGTLAGLSVGGTATLADASSLVVVNIATAGSALTLHSDGSIVVSGGVLQVPTLAISGGPSAGDFLLLDNSNNTIGTIAALSTGGYARIADSTGLTLGGTLATGGTLTLIAAGTIGGGNAVLQVTGLSATATGGGIVLNNTANAIGTADNLFATGGDVTLLDATSLRLGGTLSASNLALTVTPSGGTLDTAGASLTVPGGGTITVFADTIADSSGGGTISAPGGLVALVPYSPIPLALGGAAGTITYNGGALAPIGTGTLRLGGTTEAAPVATGLSFDGAIDLTASAATLDLATAGAVTQTPGAVLAVNTLAARAGTLDLVSTANSIAELGNITANAVTIGNGVLLTLAGSLAAPQILLTAPTLAIAAGGSLGETGATVTLDGGGVTEAAAGMLTAATLSGDETGNVALNGSNTVGTLEALFIIGAGLTLTDGTALAVAGTVAAPNIALAAPFITINPGATLGEAGAAVALASAGVNEAANATLRAGLLAGTETGAVVLPGSNAIDTLAGLTISGAGLTLNDLSALTLTGPVRLDATQTVSLTDAGQVGETASGTLVAGTLTGTLGTLDLSAGSNTLATVSDLAVTSNLTLVDTSAVTFANVVGAANATLTAPTVALTGSLALGAGGGTLALANTGTLLENGATLLAGTLDGTAGVLQLGGPQNTLGAIGSLSLSGDATLADTIPLAVASGFTAANATLVALGRLNEAAGATISVGTLVGTGGTLSLTSPANAISTIGSLTLSGDLTLADSGVLTLVGPFTAATATLMPTTLTELAGAVVSLVTLAGGGGSFALTTGANTIGTLGAIGLSGGLALTDSQSLTVTGAVSAATVALTTQHGGIAIGAAATLSGTAVTLDTPTAGITEATSGVLAASTLQGATNGTATLAGTANAVATLTDFAAGGNLILADGAAAQLAVAGKVSAGGTLGLGVGAPPGAILFTGTLAAPVLALAAGPVSESGATLSVGTIETAGSIAGAVALNGGANSIATLGSFTATGPVLLADATALTITGPVAAPSVTLTTPAALTLTGALVAPSVTLTANTLTLAGGSWLGAAGAEVSLDVGAGVSQSAAAVLAAGLLDLTVSAGSANLPGASNSIATLGVAGAPALTLVDAAPLTVAGPVAGPQITLTAPAISVAGGAWIDANGGTIDLSSSGAVTEDPSAILQAAVLQSSQGVGGDMLLPGSANNVASLGHLMVGGTFSLVDSVPLWVTGPVIAGAEAAIAAPAGLAIASTLSAPQVAIIANAISIAAAGVLGQSGAAVDLTTTSGGLNEDPAGTIVAHLLQSSGGIAGDVALAPASNRIDVLGRFAATGTFALADVPYLTVTGPVTATDITVVDQQGIEVAGSVATPGTLSLTGFPVLAIDGTGTLVAPVMTLDSPLGGIVMAAGAAVGESSTTLSLFASPVGTTQAIQESPGAVITAQRLAGGASGDATLGGTANAIATLADMSVTGTLALTDSVPLTFAGTVNAASLQLTTPSSVQEADGAALVLGTLSSPGTVGGPVILASAANAIGTLGPFAAARNLQLTDGTPLTLAGVVSAPSVIFDTPGLTLPAGTQLATETLVLQGGGVNEASSAVIDAAVLTSLGTLAGNAVLAGTGNQIATLQNFAVSSSLTLDDAIALTLAGQISAPRLVIDTEGHNATMANGTTLATNGEAAPPPTVFTTTTPPAVTDNLDGAYLSVGSFSQIGAGNVVPISGGASFFRVDAVNGGKISLDPNLGLTGPTTWLVLGLSVGPGSGGVAQGNLFVKALSVVYPQDSTNVSTNLFGTVNQLGGAEAANNGAILPLPKTTVQLNNCPIHSIGCVLLPVQTIPTASPLLNFSIGAIMSQDDSDDLLLPLVSDQDY